MKDKTILVAGGMGFIGSHLLDLLRQTYPSVKIINIDSITYAGNPDFKIPNPYIHYMVDIRDIHAIRLLVNKYKPNQVYHLAAESHVDNSINNPSVFYETNVIGTNNLLQACKECWDDIGYEDKRFVHVSTDEVYGSLKFEDEPTEESWDYRPNSPYAASKAASDLAVRAFVKTFNFPAIITNCSNNFGPRQHLEKFIPKAITNILSDKKVPVYGDGRNIRDWIYVEDHCRALIKIMNEGKAGQKYNIGSANELSNIEIVKFIAADLNKNWEECIEFVEDRKGHDFRYALNSYLLEDELMWQPEKEFEEALNLTIQYYK